jgi:hypothetical protein
MGAPEARLVLAWGKRPASQTHARRHLLLPPFHAPASPPSRPRPAPAAAGPRRNGPRSRRVWWAPSFLTQCWASKHSPPHPSALDQTIWVRTCCDRLVSLGELPPCPTASSHLSPRRPPPGAAAARQRRRGAAAPPRTGRLPTACHAHRSHLPAGTAPRGRALGKPAFTQPGPPIDGAALCDPARSTDKAAPRRRRTQRLALQGPPQRRCPSLPCCSRPSPALASPCSQKVRPARRRAVQHRAAPRAGPRPRARALDARRPPAPRPFRPPRPPYI